MLAKDGVCGGYVEEKGGGCGSRCVIDEEAAP
jgi:hypothetical protein